MRMADKEIRIITNASEREKELRNSFFNLFRDCPIPPNERLNNLSLFMSRQALSNLLYMEFLYRKIVDVHGIICEFGVRWGRNLALFESLRGIYEPFNYGRKIVGFDTFSGFPTIHTKDGNATIASKGSFSVTKGYEDYLRQVLDYHEQESPISHIKKYELVKGDASKTIVKYLDENPETIIAFAYFDMDIYEPTFKCLEAIENHLTRGSVIGFDELNLHAFPGETLALKEFCGLNKYHIRRTPLNPFCAYVVIG